MDNKPSAPPAGRQDANMHVLLLLSVFVVATCGLIYELVAGTVASYLLGDSVTQFSIIIGVYLFSMGMGSYVSKFFNKNLVAWFVQIEILVGIIGGVSSTILFLLFEQVESFRMVLYLLVSLTGILVGLEIPLLMRILQNRYEFKDLVSKVFTVDYVGALLASVIFPLFLIPYLGLLKTSFFFGILNVLVAWIVSVKFKDEIPWIKAVQTAAVLSLLGLLVGFVYAEKIMNYAETMVYQDKIIYARSSPYQRIVLTKNPREFRLFLNGNLQFSSADEYRYHEALVHPALQSLAAPQKVLILGGGDGMAVREVLKYPSVTSIVLVDLDHHMTSLFQTNEILTGLNQHSLLSPKVTVINEDAFLWLKKSKEQFDCILIDFPDPSNYSIGKLYSNTFYKLVYRVLSDSGVAVVQSTSPFVAPKSYWCIAQTLQSVGFKTLPYHTYIPSFGEWGYLMAFKKPTFEVPDSFITNLRFVNAESFKQMLVFPKDMQPVQADVNKLNNQVLVHYFEDEWANYQ
ncbi:MAG: polyamine aminopropyltransferase [Bacteroidota bacterium]